MKSPELLDAPFLDLLLYPETDEDRESFGRLEEHLDKAIDFLVHRDLPSVRGCLVRALKELNSNEIK